MFRQVWNKVMGEREEKQIWQQEQETQRLFEEAERARRAQLEEQEHIRRLIDEAERAILKDHIFVAHDGLARPDGLVLPGKDMLIGVGTPGMRRVLQRCLRLEAADLLDTVGSIFLVNLDLQEVRAFLNDLPRELHDRLVYATVDDLGSGLSNGTYREVKAAVADYGVAIQRKVDEVVNLHKRRNGVPPSEGTIDTTLGGHLYLGVVASKALRLLVPRLEIVATIDLPVDEPMREDFLLAKPEYEQGCVCGWIVTDALEFDESRDAALIDMTVAVDATALKGGASLRFNNVMKRVLPEGRGGIASFRYLRSKVVAHQFQPHPSLPLRYVVKREQVTTDLRTLINYLEQGAGNPALDVPLGIPHRKMFDIAIAAVQPYDLYRVQDDIQAARLAQREVLNGQADSYRFQTANYDTVFSSFCLPVNPDEPFCQTAVFRLSAVTDWKQYLSEIVKVPQERHFVIAEPQQLSSPAKRGPGRPPKNVTIIEGVEGDVS